MQDNSSITADHKPADNKLSGRYEHLYSMLLDAIPSSVLLIDRNITVVSANRNFLEKGHRTIANTIGFQLEEVFPSVILDQMNILKRIFRVIETEEPVKGGRLTYRAPGVPIRIYYYSILPFRWQGQVEGVLLLMDDVTEQVRLSEEVQRVERHLASIVDSASDIILSLDRKGMILTWNRAAERVTGYSTEMARERFFTDFCIDEDVQEIQDILSRIDASERTQMKECLLLTSKEELIPVSWVFSPMRDSFNHLVGVVVVGRDLTEKRKFEIELQQSQKFAALGVMAGGIAHEIRNPLTICSSSAQFLMEEDGTPEFRLECAKKIHRGIQRTSAIIENLFKYSHPSQMTMNTLFDLVELLEETKALVTYHAKNHLVEFDTSFPEEPVMVMGVPTLLQQVFMNLFLNAIKAMPTGGRLGINIEVVHSDVRGQVTDTGCGISHRLIEKIFDPFYTTSTVGQGTGLGLSLCYSIVKQHQGSITVESV